jgi:hypothetical protein
MKGSSITLLAVVLACAGCRSGALDSNNDLATADLARFDLAGDDLAGASSTDMVRVCGSNCAQCTAGPCCGTSCCNAGEWCDNGTCRCGQNSACAPGLLCATGGPVIGGNQCGITCCGDAMHPCPL